MPAAEPSGSSSAATTILQAGLLAGVLDLGYVLIYFGLRGVAAERILQGIAYAVLGPAAAKGGWGTAALGLALHFGVALAVAAVFYAASRRLAWLTRHALASGVAYGAVVWLVMNLAVLPLTALPPRAFPPQQWLAILTAHLICVGPPIAWVVRRHAARV